MFLSCKSRFEDQGLCHEMALLFFSFIFVVLPFYVQETNTQPFLTQNYSVNKVNLSLRQDFTGIPRGKIENLYKTSIQTLFVFKTRAFEGTCS